MDRSYRLVLLLRPSSLKTDLYCDVSLPPLAACPGSSHNCVYQAERGEPNYCVPTSPGKALGEKGLWGGRRRGRVIGPCLVYGKSLRARERFVNRTEERERENDGKAGLVSLLERGLYPLLMLYNHGIPLPS